MPVRDEDKVAKLMALFGNLNHVQEDTQRIFRRMYQLMLQESVEYILVPDHHRADRESWHNYVSSVLGAFAIMIALHHKDFPASAIKKTMLSTGFQKKFIDELDINWDNPEEAMVQLARYTRGIEVCHEPLGNEILFEIAKIGAMSPMLCEMEMLRNG